MLYCKNTKELTMLKLIGLVTVVWLLFYFNVIQIVAGALAVGLFWVAAL